MENEKKLYQKWWFWSVIIVAIIIICLVFGRTEETSSSTNSVNKNNTTEDYEKLNENPYIITNDYDGTYKFTINNDAKTIIGVINIDGGNLKTKFSNIDNSFAVPIYNGVCGLKKEDNKTFYITIKNSAYETIREFKCIKSDKNLLGESLTMTDYKNVDFVYVNNNKDIENIYNEVLNQEKAKKEAEKKAKKEQEEKDFKAGCQTYTFEQMARNPDNFKGTNVKVTGEVVQALYDENTVDLRVNITKKGNYSTYYTDTVYVIYTPDIGEDKILEDDIITIYGTSKGDYSYTSTMGSKITLPLIDAKYIVLQK